MLKTKLEPPYYACIFTSVKGNDTEGYSEMMTEMLALASEQEGYLGIESASETEDSGITISYWTSIEAIRQWKAHPMHLLAQKLGQEKWYEGYTLRICRVDRDICKDLNEN